MEQDWKSGLGDKELPVTKDTHTQKLEGSWREWQRGILARPRGLQGQRAL